jgi:hypothetical protein
MEAVMRIRGFLILLLALVFGQACTGLGSSHGFNDEQSGDNKPAARHLQSQASAPVASPTAKIYKDPITGEFTTPPPGTKPPSVPVTIQESTSTAPVPTMQEKAVEAGGMKLDLQGRYRSYSSVTKDADGTLKIHCKEVVDSEAH